MHFMILTVYREKMSKQNFQLCEIKMSIKGFKNAIVAQLSRVVLH